MTNSAQSEHLLALEGLMNEFFLPATTNERKRNIEELLNNFSQQKDAWQYCLLFIKQTSNEYVMMYALSVLETLINKQWHGMTTESKKIIRESIVEHLVKAHTQLPGFIVNKMSKLNVDIARHDWPHFYHDFLSNILELMTQQETAGLGVVLLQTTSEEMANPREDLSISRKHELKQLLLEMMPRILAALCNILDGVLERHKLLSTTTPPPSPTRQAIGSPAHSSPKPGQSYQNANIFQSPAFKPASSRSLIPFDKVSQVLCSQALSCIGHLFSWVPLSTMITSHLLNTVFSFAAFGCESTRNTTSGSQSLGMLAMCCINELLSKNCVPANFESYLLQLFQQTFYLLKKMTQDNVKTLDALDSSFLDKFTEFVRLFVNHHLRRFEANPHFPVLEFLSLLFEYTFKQPTMEDFFACLNIWQIFVDYIKSKAEERNTKNLSLERYSDGILALVRELLKKMQFTHNAAQLEELDDETVDDDGMTEMQTFISNCNDTVESIAELVYDDVTPMLDNMFQENITIYINLESHLSNTSQQTPQVINRVHCCLKDLCTVLQTSARLVDYCTGGRFDAKFAHTEKLAKQLIELAVYNEKTRLFSRQYSSEHMRKLVPDFIEMYAHTLASLKAYSHWLAQYYVESYHRPGVREQCAELITSIVNSVYPTVNHQVPAKILEWSVNVLTSILTQVKPVYLYDVHCIQELYKKVSEGFAASFPPKLSAQLRSALSSYLILRWPALPDSEQKWDMRTSNHAAFIASLHPLYLMLKNVSPATLTSNSADAQQAKTVVVTTLNSLHHLVSSIKEETKKTKEIMYQSITEYIELSLQLFSVYISQSDVLEKIVDFFLILVQCLRVQMGISFTEQTIQTFLELFTRERIVEILSQNNKTAYKVIESFLKMLELIVQEQASAFRKLLPKIISICMDHIYPIVAPKPSPDIKLSLYELLFELMDNNWKYFYKSPVIKTFGSVNPAEPLTHQQEFVSILHAFGQSFLQPDITIFKHNLEALEKLHKKWNLYTKTVFLETMMSQFLNVLLQALVVKSHDLLQEDIVAAVYNMAAVDFSMFYKTFILDFLKQVNTIDYHQKQTLHDNLNPHHKDLPSFTQDIQRMINDLRYYAIINASLPPGTIDLSQKEPEPISEY